MKKIFSLVAALMAVFAATAQDANSKLSNSSKPDKIAFNNAIIWGYTTNYYKEVYDIADLSFEDFKYAVSTKSTPLAYKFGELVVSGKSEYDVPLEYDGSHKEYLVGFIGLDEQDAKKIYAYDSRNKKISQRNVYKYEQNGKVAAYDDRGNFIGEYSVKFDEQGRIVRLDWTRKDIFGGIKICYVEATYDSSNCINMLDYHDDYKSENKGKITISRSQHKYVKTGEDTWSYMLTLSSGETDKYTFEIQERDEKGRWTKGVFKYPNVDTRSVGVVQRQVFRSIDPQREFFNELLPFNDFYMNARALSARYK